MSDIRLREMLEHLSQVEDTAWGMYAFSRDMLRHKVGDEQKKDMIQKAICCGYRKAEEIMEQMGTSDPWEIARRLGLTVEYLDRGQIADRVLFALFTPPSQIQIMREPIDKAMGQCDLPGFISREQIENLILSHEIFHYLEEEEETIYTRTEKICLWKLLGYENRSTIRALSEIAGMYFSRKINRFPYSPFALDILLYYNYNSEEALEMYREVVTN